MTTLLEFTRRLKGLPDSRLMTLDGHDSGSGHNDGGGFGRTTVFGDGDVGDGGGSDLSISLRDGFTIYANVAGAGYGFGYGYARGGGEST